jgi:hypothetical protein
MRHFWHSRLPVRSGDLTKENLYWIGNFFSWYFLFVSAYWLFSNYNFNFFTINIFKRSRLGAFHQVSDDYEWGGGVLVRASRHAMDGCVLAKASRSWRKIPPLFSFFKGSTHVVYITSATCTDWQVRATQLLARLSPFWFLSCGMRALVRDKWGKFDERMQELKAQNVHWRYDTCVELLM